MCKNINKISYTLKKYLMQYLRANIKDIYVQDVRDGLNRDGLKVLSSSIEVWLKANPRSLSEGL